MSEELRFHLDMEVRSLLAKGIPPERARRMAMMKLGGEEMIREESREARGTGFWDRTAQDRRHGPRTLRRAPGFTAMAILTLGLGIGGTVALSSVIYGILVRPLPVEGGERLFSFWSPQQWRASEYDFAREHLQAFESVAAYSSDGVTLGNGRETVLAEAIVASANLFEVLGRRPLLGQAFRPGDDQACSAPVVVLSHGVWQNQFGGDPGLVGKRIEVNGRSTTVLGIMPRGFYFPGPDVGVWTPLDLDPMARSYDRNGWLALVGRAQRGITEPRLRSDVDALALADPVHGSSSGGSLGKRSSPDPHSHAFEGMGPRYLPGSAHPGRKWRRKAAPNTSRGASRRPHQPGPRSRRWVARIGQGRGSP